jgi:HprK-related kinase A
MRLATLPERDLSLCMSGAGIRLHLGRLTICIATDVRPLQAQFASMYADHAVQDAPGIDDAVVQVRYTSPLRRYLAPKVQGYVDGRIAFLPLAARASLVMLESCLNWAIIGSGPDCLMLHAAALERNGRAVILPAGSGAGKSTLSTAMMARGWRLLTDETVIIRPADGRLLPLARPISLKNDSISIARGLFGDAMLSTVFHGMPKGDMAYLRPPPAAVARLGETALPAHIVAPRFVRGESLQVTPVSRCSAFRLIVDSAVNYTLMLRAGFDLVGNLVRRCPAQAVRFGDLAAMLDWLDTLEPPAVA